MMLLQYALDKNMVVENKCQVKLSFISIEDIFPAYSLPSKLYVVCLNGQILRVISLILSCMLALSMGLYKHLRHVDEDL
jgi:hypothetical protein